MPKSMFFVGAPLGFAPLVSISLHRSAVEYSLRRSAVFLKEASDEAEPPSLHGVGSICEFDEGKQGHARGLLGVIIKAESKAKGGARYEVLDADGRTHPIKAAQVRATFAASKKLKDPLDAPLVLADYVSVAEKAPTELGVEPEMLEVAWELASEADAPLSAKQILGVIDEVRSPTAHRALHSASEAQRTICLRRSAPAQSSSSRRTGCSPARSSCTLCTLLAVMCAAYLAVPRRRWAGSSSRRSETSTKPRRPRQWPRRSRRSARPPTRMRMATSFAWCDDCQTGPPAHAGTR